MVERHGQASLCRRPGVRGAVPGLEEDLASAPSQAPMEVSRPAMPSDQMAGPCPFLHFIASDARSTTQT